MRMLLSPRHMCLLACAAVTIWLSGRALAQQLGDPGLEGQVGKDLPREAVAGGWSIPPGPPYADGIAVRQEAASARQGAGGLRLTVSSWGRLAAARQTVELPAGLYEFKVWAKGEGLIILCANGLRRRGDLGGEWAQYSLTFEQRQPGPVRLTIMADRQAEVDDASLDAAAAERVAAWQAQEKARAEYGFVPEYLSAQLPQPGAPPRPPGTFQGGPVTWRERVVYYDRRYDTAWSLHPETLAAYLGANGFQVLEAPAFGEWMRRVTREGAYGTVCVMTHGICPASVWEDKPETSTIRRYLEAGGRVVWLGDVAFYYGQDETHPQVFSKGGLTAMTGVRGGWNLGCWGNQSPVTLTELGRAWGLAEVGPSAIAAYPEDVTAALSGFHSDYADSDLAVCWFKNYSPLHPWSGLIFAHKGADYHHPQAQESAYRLALYAGRPVEAPPGIKVEGEEEKPLRVVLDPPRDRRCFYRGESIPVRIEATAQTPAGLGPLLLRLEPPGAVGGTLLDWPDQSQPATGTLRTADLACGDYRLRVTPANADKERVLWEAEVFLRPRQEDPTFFFGVAGASAGNSYRQEMMLKDLAAHGMQNGSVTENTPAGILDLTLKYGLRFGMRAHGTPRLTEQEREEALRRGPSGEPLPGAWEGGRPILGLLHPRVRETAAQDMARQVYLMAAWPAAWLRCHTADDFSVYYGWDWSDLAKRTFREKTGLEAPVPPEIAQLGAEFRRVGKIAREPGIIPDDDPWLQWNIFCTKDIGGGYNKALTEACVQAVPGIKVGPVPGGMQLPLWCQGQYPPHHFGPAGFNLLHYYYYLNYWQPTIGNLYWSEVARMGNRDLELWVMPDCAYQESPAYYVNTFFLQVAGGAQGLNYYTYTEALPVAWETLGRIGNTIVKPLYPFLGKLRPARTTVGLLLPYTQWCFNWLYPTNAVYPYANLLGAQVDVQPTCEEEVLSGDARRYQAILLWRVQYLRQSVVTALEDYIAQGGVVICDATTQVPLKGAVRIPVDLAMGEGKSDPDPNDPRLGGPGIMDYLHPDRVDAVRRALAPYARPWVDCSDPTLIARRHEYRGVTYLWLVNIESQEEYEYLRPRVAAGARPESPEQAKREAVRYLAERTEGRRFRPLVTIPAGTWAAYDVLQGKRISLQKAGDRLGFQADMERLGGQLIALYPEALGKIAIRVAATVRRGEQTPLEIAVLGASGKPLAGTQPLAVEVITPQGAWPEITGAHATDDGVWAGVLYPARNDPAGQWRIRVKELSSGTRAEAIVTVK